MKKELAKAKAAKKAVDDDEDEIVIEVEDIVEKSGRPVSSRTNSEEIYSDKVNGFEKEVGVAKAETAAAREEIETLKREATELKVRVEAHEKAEASAALEAIAEADEKKKVIVRLKY